jgi:putative phage-type endonuclease
MKTVNLIQGSAEWLAHRAQHFNASDAPAMLGLSPYKTRTELIRERATGLAAEVDPVTQRRFDDGHRSERLARPLAEKIIGEELSPLVGVADHGTYSASFDGLTMMEDQAFEHKALNNRLRAAMVDGCSGADLPEDYQVQMEHQCMVCPSLERVLFMASKWADDGTLIEERHCWYTPNPALRARVVAGWKQFAEDVANYSPPAASAVEKIVAEPVESLPAPFVQVTGQLTLQDNFKVFEERLRDFLDNQLIREPKTDEDFVNLDAQIKAMKQGREALKAAKAQMLAQVQPVDMANKAADTLDKLLQQNCKLAEDLLSAEKERRRGEIVAAGVKGLQDHIAALNQRLGKPYMPQVPADFGAAIKGLKSLASMDDKVGAELTRAKIAASEIADRIQINLTTLREYAAEHAFLFPDTAQIVQKAPDDLTTLVKARIAEHQEKERIRIEVERERIRAEEQAKAKSDADAAIAASTAAAAPTSAPAPSAPALTPAPVLEVIASAPAANEPAPGMPPALSIGVINERLKYFTVTAEALRGLGFEPAGRERAAPRYHEHQFPGICEAVAKRALLVRQDFLQPRAA